MPNRRSGSVLRVGDTPNIPTQRMSSAPRPGTTHTYAQTSGAVYTHDWTPSLGSDQSVLENSCTAKVSVKGGLTF